MRLQRKVVELALVAIVLILVTHADAQKSSDIECDLETHYLCSEGSKCIFKSYVCNGQDDCGNNEDEQNCGKY